MMHRLILSTALALAVLWTAATPTFAHRPYFEDKDIVASKPWRIDNPTISTVVYATLQTPGDVDYYAFDGKAGQRILLEITIPQIAGQEDFAPTMALMGPGLPSARLPATVEKPVKAGAQILPPPTGPAETFYEPFSRTSYWERQSQRMTLPQDGRYVVAIWHPTRQLGRYGFVIGDREIPGGDLAFSRKLRSYWTPVPAPATP